MHLNFKWVGINFFFLCLLRLEIQLSVLSLLQLMSYSHLQTQLETVYNALWSANWHLLLQGKHDNLSLGISTQATAGAFQTVWI